MGTTFELAAHLAETSKMNIQCGDHNMLMQYSIAHPKPNGSENKDEEITSMAKDPREDSDRNISHDNNDKPIPNNQGKEGFVEVKYNDEETEQQNNTPTQNEEFTSLPSSASLQKISTPSKRKNIDRTMDDPWEKRSKICVLSSANIL